MDSKDPKVTPVDPATNARTASPVCQDPRETLVCPVSPAAKEIAVSTDCPVPTERTAFRVQTEPRETPESVSRKDAPIVHLAKEDSLEILDPRVLMEKFVSMVPREILECLVCRARTPFQDDRERREIAVSLAIRAERAYLEPKAALVFQDVMEPRERPVFPAFLD